MPILQGPELAVWCELLAVVGIGSGVAVGLAALVSRRVRSAVWERAVWQACTLTLLALVTLEVTGLGAAAVRLCVVSWSQARHDSEIPGLAFERLLADEGETATSYRTPVADPSIAAPVHIWWPALVWGVGALGILGRMVWGRAILGVFWWRCEPLRDAAVRLRVQSIANRLGLRMAIRTLTSRSLRSPAVFQWFVPVLALPSGFSEEYSDLQQEAVLAHELAHLARRDPAWQAAAMLACAVLWWQPLSWWSYRRLRAASEAAADEASVLLPGGPSQLAASLVSLAQRLSDPQVATVTSMLGNGLKSDLAHRVKRLLELENGALRAPSRPKLALAHGALPISFLLLCMCCTAWAPSRRSSTQGDTTVNLLTNAWRSSLAATAIWTALGGGSELAADEPRRGETVEVRAEIVQDTDRRTPGEQDRVREVLGAIRQQVEQLQEEGKREAAERLLQVAETMTRKFASDVDAQSQDRREAFQKKLKVVKEQAEKLAKDGKHDEAEKLMREAEAMARSYKVELDRRNVDRSQGVKEKLSRIREEAQKLAKEGKGEEAEKLMQEAEAMARSYKVELDRRNIDRSQGVKEKLSRIREQAQKLAKDGKGEQAEKLMREAEAMARTYKEQIDRLDVDRSQGTAKDLFRQLVERGRKEGNPEAAERVRQRAEGLARELKELDGPERALRAERERLVEALRAVKGYREATDRVAREAEPLTRELAGRDRKLQQAARSELVRQKLKATRDEADQLRKLGKQEAAEKLMREAEAMARSLEDRIDAPRRESADDLRAGLREVQRDLKELRDQLKKLQDARSSNRE